MSAPLKLFYLVPFVQPWKQLQVQVMGKTVDAPFAGPVGSCGFVQAYDSLEAFKRDFPKLEPLIISEVVH